MMRRSLCYLMRWATTTAGDGTTVVCLVEARLVNPQRLLSYYTPRLLLKSRAVRSNGVI